MDVEEIKESMNTCCGSTGFDIRQVRVYVNLLESEIERLERHRAILLLVSGIFLVRIVLMMIF